MGRIDRVDPRCVVAATMDGRSYTATLVGAPGRERGKCPHDGELESLARIGWHSCTVEVWLCRGCDDLVYRTAWASPGWVATKARIGGELTLQALALAEERLMLRRWARRARP